MTEERRGRHVLDAAVRLIAADGLAGVSVRAVATEAGVSIAQVQYYFRSKDELIAAAFAHAGEEFLARLTTVAGQPRSARRLLKMIDQWLPLDEERERRVKVWLAFIGAAATRPELAEIVRQTDREIVDWLAEDLAELGVPDPNPEAARLLALIDGVALRCLTLTRRARTNLIKQTIGPYLGRYDEMRRESD